VTIVALKQEGTMDTELTHAARIQLARSLRRRYQAASSRAKKQILNEFIAVSGYHPKYAVHLLNAADSTAPVRSRRVRSTIYDDAAKQALIVLWEASDRVCGKRLKPLLGILVPALERHGHLKLDEVIRTKVLAMSAATIDRLLRGPRNATRTRKLRRVTPEIRRRIAVRTLPIGTSRHPAAWKWIWSRTAETRPGVATCIASCSPISRVAGPSVRPWLCGKVHCSWRRWSACVWGCRSHCERWTSITAASS
jgi:hypothetical protein